MSSAEIFTQHGRVLKLIALWVKNSADDILKYFSYFSQKIGTDNFMKIVS